MKKHALILVVLSALTALICNISAGAGTATQTPSTIFRNATSLSQLGTGVSGPTFRGKAVVPWVDVESFANFSSAKAYAEANKRAIHVNSHVTANNLTIKTEVDVLQGGDLYVNTGKTVTFNQVQGGRLVAGDYQYCLTGPGNAVGVTRIRPEWLGAKGDAATDSSAVWVRCFSSIGTSTQGRVVLNPEANYRINTTVALDGYNNKVIEGNGAIISTTASIPVLQISNASGFRIDSVNFRDVSVDSTIYTAVYAGDLTPSSKNAHLAAFHTRSTAVYLYGKTANQPVTGVTINNCGFDGFYYAVKGYGNALGAAAPVKDIHFSRCMWTRNFAGVVALGYQYVNGYGACDNWTFSDKCIWDSNWHWGMWVSAGDTTPNSYTIQDFKFSDCDFLNTYEEHGAYIQGRNHTFTGCTFKGNNSAGIRSYGNPGMKVTGCTFENNGRNLNSSTGQFGADVGQGYASPGLFSGSEREPAYTETYEGVGIGLVNNRFYNNYMGLQFYCDKIRARVVANEVYDSDIVGIDLRQVGEGIIALNTSSSNGGDGFYLTSYGGAGSYSGRSDYVSFYGNTAIGNTGYGVNVPAGAANYFKMRDNTVTGNTAGNWNVLADSRSADVSFSLSATGTIPNTPSSTFPLRFSNMSGVTSIRAFAGMTIKAMTVNMSDAPSAGTITVQPTRNGGNIGTGSAFHHSGARVYPDEGGLGYVLVTENLGVNAITSSDYTGSASNRLLVTLLMGYSPNTFYDSDYSDEKIVNGSFADSSSWYLQGAWTVSGGAASTSGNDGSSAHDLYQAVPGLATGKLYRVTYTVTSISSGAVYAEVLGVSGTGPSTGKGTARTAPGTYTETITGGLASYFRIHVDAGTTCSVTNISLIEYLN